MAHNSYTICVVIAVHFNNSRNCVLRVRARYTKCVVVTTGTAYTCRMGTRKRGNAYSAEKVIEMMEHDDGNECLRI